MLDGTNTPDLFKSFNGWVEAGSIHGRKVLNAQFTMASGKTQHISPERVVILATQTSLQPDFPTDQKTIILQAFHSRPR